MDDAVTLYVNDPITREIIESSKFGVGGYVTLRKVSRRVWWQPWTWFLSPITEITDFEMTEVSLALGVKGQSDEPQINQKSQEAHGDMCCP